MPATTSSTWHGCRRKKATTSRKVPTSKRRQRRGNAIVSPQRVVIDLDNLREAAAGLAGVGERTPLIPLPFSGLAGEVRLRAEPLQPIGAFKIRGAWTALRRMSDDARARGVVTSSSGNHGLGI